MDVGPPEGRTELGPLLESVMARRSDFVCIGSASNEILYLNEFGKRLVEAENDGTRKPQSPEDFFDPEYRAYFREVILSEVARRGHWMGDSRLHNMRTGEPLAVALDVFRLDAPDGERPCIALIAQDVSERIRAELRTKMLVDAGAALSTSLEYEQTFKELARLVVAGFASYCIIDVFGEAGGRQAIRRVATHHVDRARAALVERLNEYVPDFERPSKPLARALLDGTSTLMNEVDEEWIEEITLGPEHAAILRDLGLRSWMTVSLVANGKILGALTCGLGVEDTYRPGFAHGYDAEDLFLLEELGRRAGTTIENARLYEYQRNIAVALQAASLPSSLPHIDHLRLAAEYRPGSDEATIGGDWYDAFQLEDERVVLTVGDVLGHGLHAAVAMTKLRQAMQSAAMVDADPVLMLDVADRTLGLHDPEGYATAVAAVFDPRDHVLHIASAGHPPPLVRHVDGTVHELTAPGTLLGIRSGHARGLQRFAMPDNCVLVFYTDGLIEATRDIEAGSTRLRDALRRLDVGHPEPARWLVETVLGTTVATDDIAMLCARIAPPQAPEEPAIQASYDDGTLLTVTA